MQKATNTRTVQRATVSPTRQLAGFLAKFEPRMATQIRATRRAMQKILPGAFELVYDNYNFFVIGYSPTERASDCIVSLAANSKGIALSFYRGATLADPAGILQGSGSQNRFVRLKSAATLNEPAVKKLIAAAVAQSKVPLARSGGRLVIKSVSAKQRPRR